MKKISLKIDWKKGLVPAIIQDFRTNAVLMLGYMNEQSFRKTLSTQRVWFYSRSKKRLWMKGETSGNFLNVVNVKVDCDSDTLLIKANPQGPSCHNGLTTCFGSSEKFENAERQNSETQNILADLYSLITERKKHMPENSYTAFLFQKGLNKICAKVKEESGEVIRAAKKETRKRLIEESVDVLYHLFVLLVEKGVKMEEVLREVEKRRIKNA